MPICIYHKDSFGNASAEHILQNSLGARWTSEQIVCNPLQAEFGRTIDVAFPQGLQPIRVLLGTPSGRGREAPPIKGVTTTSGEKIDVLPGGRPRLAEPVVNVTPSPDGHLHIDIQAGTEEQIGWAVHQLLQRYPELAGRIDPAKLAPTGQVTRRYVAGHAPLQFGLGGPEYFRGLLKSCVNLLGVVTQQGVLHESVDPVRRFVLSGEGRMSDFVRWSSDSEPLQIPRIGDYDHFLGIVSRNGALEGVVQLFGCIVHPIRLADGYNGPSITCGYLVDPTRESDPAEIRNPEFEPNVIPQFSAQHLKPCEAVRSAHSRRLTRFLPGIYERANEAMISEIVDEVRGPSKEGPITHEMFNVLSQRLAEHVAERYAAMTYQNLGAPPPAADSPGGG